ncbi:MAG: FAD-dependent oxidoreductase [Eubacterium sp.]|nr:FAD-dependent oxidoreductase [Eubacterium sp.]
MEKSCDVLVLGGGGSGLIAAVKAAEAGKKVTVLEKAKFLGGGMLFASTQRIFGSRWQKERNIPDQSIDFMRKGMDETLWKLDAGLVHDAIYATGRFFDWYSEHELPEVMEKYEPRPYVFDIPVNGQVCPQIDVFHNGSGRFVVETMKRYGEELGVEMLTEHAAKDAIVEDGRIVGVVADTPNGEVTFRCDKCLIAMSSWIKNEDVVNKVLPGFTKAQVEKNAHQNPAYMGDGLAIAEKVGAFIDWDSFCLRIMGPICYFGDHSDLDTLCKSPSPILVNLLGRRFVAEPMVPRMDPFDTGHVLLQQPEGKSYFIFSKNMLEDLIESSRDNKVEGDFDLFGLPPLPEYDVVKGWFEKGAEKNPKEAAVSDTIEGIARRLGLDEAELVKTVSSYNECCAKGVDSDFFRDASTMVPLSEGPFFAVGGMLSTDGAFGGVRVNRHMQAYAADEVSLIDGLYVTGDFASGRHIVADGVKKQVLNDMSWAYASGYIAGEELGK